ncbi:MAG: carbohydrate kinase family protein [Clostridia bacterium]|nr:carbohydrate kinase family protein [Clostridia bacterium]
MEGIAVAGTLLVDKINEISSYPASGELTQIKSVRMATGGLVPNVSIDLRIMDNSLPVKAVGKLGSDGEGAFIQSILEKYGVDTKGITYASTGTSFTDVMSVTGGQRTFFTYAGANAGFGVADVDFTLLNVKILHLGYFLLLDKMDSGEGVALLKQAKEKGIETSIDLVSENSNRYSMVLPCLPYTDYLIINEVEAGGLTGIESTESNLKKIAETLFSFGVKKRVVIHTPSVGVCLSENGFFAVPSYDLPKGYIKGTTGAGDAFCAGMLLGIYRGWDETECLSFAAGAAAVSLCEADANSGMRSEKGIKEFCKNLNRRKLCL